MIMVLMLQLKQMNFKLFQIFEGRQAPTENNMIVAYFISYDHDIVLIYKPLNDQKQN